MALVKGTLSRFVWKMFFYKGLNKKSFLLEALMVSDLQASLEAQAFKISLFKHFAVRNSYGRRMLRGPGGTRGWFIIVTPFIIGTDGLGKGNPF